MKKILLITIFLALPLYAQFYLHTEEFYGIRPLGMGAAFIGLSDDMSALSYCPAGLSSLKYNQASVVWSPSLGEGFTKWHADVSYQIARGKVLALDWQHLGYADTIDGSYGVPELSSSDGRINAGFGIAVSEKISVGLSMKIQYSTLKFDTEDQGNGAGYSFGLSSLCSIHENLKAGIALYNIFPSKTPGLLMKYGESSVLQMKYPFSVRSGIYYSPIKHLSLMCDVVNPLNVGAEYWIMNMFGVRAGLRQYFGPSTAVLSGGFSFRYSFGQLDYALNLSSGLVPEHFFGFTAAWGYQARMVDIMSAEIKEVFPSLYKTYEKEEMIRVVLKNKSKKPLDAKIGFFVDHTMKSPTEKKITLLPGIATELKMPAVFSEQITTTKDDKVVNANIILSYRIDDRESKDISSYKFTLYSRNAFVWDDMDRIASFVTPQDETIKAFGRDVLQKFKSSGTWLVSKNFHRAMSFFDALGAWGMTYVPDPANSFGAGSTIDYIQYPAETLASKTGDCDDCSVLFASLLESIGIPTMFIITPDHIFLMFDSGLTLQKAQQAFGNEEIYLEMDNRVWIPVEATMYGKPFFHSIKEAVVSLIGYLDADSDKINFVSVENAWSKYPSAAILMKGRVAPVVKEEKVTEMLKRDAITYIIMREGEKFQTVMAELENNPEDKSLNNKMGIFFGKYGMLSPAKEYFTKAKEKDPEWSSPYHNLANLYLLQGDYPSAVKEYEAGLKRNPENQTLKEGLEKARKLQSGSK